MPGIGLLFLASLSTRQAMPGVLISKLPGINGRMVEAAGVEPASEIARYKKTTCVAAFRIFGDGLETGKITAT